ncbi:aldo/keto reductase [Saccharothrix syringae]|uniref:Aldo/keto reductase n=1 Tax=Saccharothrix syringae TaxID=103733 RepID=A0A5Q0GWE6_SACSY|nr:aldo/keto reductase [Saccharothrix syringae]QFZ17834.1 aldo/keto reductase [Saccharothrix syringae]
MSLASRTLGETGMNITRVGFGAWAIGGGGWRYAWGDQDDAESIAAIRHAVESGINWIDTAAVYGLGHSEEVVGRAIRDLPEADRPYVFTKCGLVWDERNPDAPPHRIMRPDSVRREVEASLRRLGVERIDLYQVHWPDTGASLEYDGTSSDGPAPQATPVEEYWAVMAKLKAEGKVRAIGLSNHDLGLLERAREVAPVDALQPPFSAINRSNAAEIAWCAEQGGGVIVYSPMQSGLLTGSFSAERAANLPDNDWRRGHVDFTANLDRNLALAEALRPVARRHGTTVAAVAVAWALAWPGVTGAIVGARNPRQVDGWLPAASLELTGEDLAEVASATASLGAGEGPVRP